MKPLRKKICVSVFLDELFEEIDDVVWSSHDQLKDRTYRHDLRNALGSKEDSLFPVQEILYRRTPRPKKRRKEMNTRVNRDFPFARGYMRPPSSPIVKMTSRWTECGEKDFAENQNPEPEVTERKSPTGKKQESGCVCRSARATVTDAMRELGGVIGPTAEMLFIKGIGQAGKSRSPEGREDRKSLSSDTREDRKSLSSDTREDRKSLSSDTREDRKSLSSDTREDRKSLSSDTREDRKSLSSDTREERKSLFSGSSKARMMHAAPSMTVRNHPTNTNVAAPAAKCCSIVIQKPTKVIVSSSAPASLGRNGGKSCEPSETSTGITKHSVNVPKRSRSVIAPSETRSVIKAKSLSKHNRERSPCRPSISPRLQERLQERPLPVSVQLSGGTTILAEIGSGKNGCSLVNVSSGEENRLILESLAPRIIQAVKALVLGGEKEEIIGLVSTGDETNEDSDLQWEFKIGVPGKNGSSVDATDWYGKLPRAMQQRKEFSSFICYPTTSSFCSRSIRNLCGDLCVLRQMSSRVL
ncbi:UNVERIFIED_CONTAM: hypothetical protein PYX00_004082 [Menopon gallinae]|uniref:Uncharacterized protein n=1 Tax=Menopon gallinae TaxID=328185 RepID=A0AAW2I375_9NEOP